MTVILLTLRLLTGCSGPALGWDSEDSLVSTDDTDSTGVEVEVVTRSKELVCEGEESYLGLIEVDWAQPNTVLPPYTLWAETGEAYMAYAESNGGTMPEWTAWGNLGLGDGGVVVGCTWLDVSTPEGFMYARWVLTWEE